MGVVGGDGPARGGGAVRRRARQRRPTACPRCWPSSPARSRCCGPSRARCSGRCPTSTRCCWACAGGGRPPTRRSSARWCTAPSRTGARRWPGRWPSRAAARRLRARRARRGPARRWSSSATRADERAERLAPEEFRELAARLARMTVLTRERAPRQGQPLPVPRTDARRRAPRAGDAVRRRSRCSTTSRSTPPADGRGRLPRRRRPQPRRRRAPSRCARAGWAAPPLRVDDHQADPGRGRAWAAARPTRPRCCASRRAWRPAGRSAALRSPPGLAPTCPASWCPARGSAPARGTRLQAAPELAPYALVVLPQPFPLSTADVYREADRLGSAGGSAERAGRPCAPGSTRVVLARELVVNDLEPAALSLAPRLGETLGAIGRAGADDAIVCGSGPTRDRAVLGSGRRFTRARGRLAAARGSTPRWSPPTRFAEGTARRRRTSEVVWPQFAPVRSPRPRL